MKLVEVVKWDGFPDMFAYRFPETALNTKVQLIVTESQEAVFLKEGEFYGPFGPGRHVLDTKNLPFLTSLATSFLTGGVSPFTAEVWFVQKAIPLDLKWGTNVPIQVEDPKYHIMLPVRAFGQYGLQITNSQKFLAKLVGRIPTFTTDILDAYFKGIIISHAKDCISKYLVEKGISILQISTRILEISELLQEKISEAMDDYGLQTLSFTVHSVTTDENDSAVQQLKAALAKKAEMDIIGYTYHQERSFDTMETAAGNPGGGAVMNAGIGMGMGVGLGIPIAGAMKNFAENLTAEQVTKCPNCNASIKGNAKFCPECGNALRQTFSEDSIKCRNCGAKISSNIKFCPECGVRINIFCKKCGTELNGTEKFCPECGTARE